MSTNLTLPALVSFEDLLLPSLAYSLVKKLRSRRFDHPHSVLAAAATLPHARLHPILVHFSEVIENLPPLPLLSLSAPLLPSLCYRSAPA